MLSKHRALLDILLRFQSGAVLVCRLDGRHRHEPVSLVIFTSSKDRPHRNRLNQPAAGIDHHLGNQPNSRGFLLIPYGRCLVLVNGRSNPWL